MLNHVDLICSQNILVLLLWCDACFDLLCPADFFNEGVFYIDVMWLKELLTLHEIGAKALWVSGVCGQSLVDIGVFPNRQEV